MAIRVTVFEDKRDYREYLSYLIGGSPGLELAGARESAEDAVSVVEEWEPNVILMDIAMSGEEEGIEAVKKINKQFPEIGILMHTLIQDDDKIFKSIANGASGYILKSASPVQILEAIDQVYYGGSPMSPSIARRVLILFKDFLPKEEKGNDYDLTPREKDVLTLMCKGKIFKEIAKELGIAYETVRTHVKHSYEKLHVASGKEAVAKAIREGLVK